MAWTTTSDFAVGHVVTAAEWNALAGVTGNTQYLYDRFSTVTQASTAKVIGTEYQNTTGKLLFVAISVGWATGAAGTINDHFRCSSTSPASTGTFIGGVAFSGAVGIISADNISFIAPPGFYYKVISNDTGTGTTSVNAWNEWTLHIS